MVSRRGIANPFCLKCYIHQILDYFLDAYIGLNKQNKGYFKIVLSVYSAYSVGTKGRIKIYKRLFKILYSVYIVYSVFINSIYYLLETD